MSVGERRKGEAGRRVSVGFEAELVRMKLLRERLRELLEERAMLRLELEEELHARRDLRDAALGALRAAYVRQGPPPPSADGAESA